MDKSVSVCAGGFLAIRPNRPVSSSTPQHSSIPKPLKLYSGPPDAHAVNPAERETRCHNCLKTPTDTTTAAAAAMLRCGRCGWQRYCGKRCQRADWAAHKFECLALKRLKAKSPGPTLLMAARLLRLLVVDDEGQGRFAEAVGELVCNEARLPGARRQLMGEMAALVRGLCLTEATKTGDPAAWEFDRKMERTLARLGGLEYVVSEL